MCNIFGYIYMYISTYTTQKDPQQKKLESCSPENPAGPQGASEWPQMMRATPEKKKKENLAAFQPQMIHAMGTQNLHF